MIVPHIILPFILTFSFFIYSYKGRPKGAHTPDKTPGDPTPEEPEIRQSKRQPKPIGIAGLLASCKFYMVMH